MRIKFPNGKLPIAEEAPLFIVEKVSYKLMYNNMCMKTICVCVCVWNLKFLAFRCYFKFSKFNFNKILHKCPSFWKFFKLSSKQWNSPQIIWISSKHYITSKHSLIQTHS
jgi:hypothetical protein